MNTLRSRWLLDGGFYSCILSGTLEYISGWPSENHTNYDAGS